MRRVVTAILAICIMTFSLNPLAIQAAQVSRVMDISADNVIIDSPQAGETKTVVVSLTDEALQNGNQMVYCQTVDATQKVCTVTWGTPTSRNTLPLVITPTNNGTTFFYITNTYNDEQIILTVTVSGMGNTSKPGNNLENFKPIYIYNSQFKDIANNSWYSESVSLVYEYGLMNGKTSTTFAPDGNITIAETIALASRLHSIYYGDNFIFTQSVPWYETYVTYAQSNGIIANTTFTNYNKDITRSQFAEIIASSLPDTAFTEINSIADGAIPDVRLGAEGGNEIYQLYRAGILTGNDQLGTFAPDSFINRASVAAILSRIVDTSLRKVLAISDTDDIVTDASDDQDENEFVEVDPVSQLYTVDDLENYLNENMGSCTTPMGTYTYEFTIEENSYNYHGYDLWIRTDHTGVNGYPWFDLQYSHAISETDKTETLNILKAFQERVYEVASRVFPKAKIMGGFYDGFYRYPSLQVGYETTRALTWTNYNSSILEQYDSTYITSFHWDATLDDYDFTK